jgi:hypothetical protein
MKMLERKLHFHPWPLMRNGLTRERALGLETSCGNFRRSVYLTTKAEDVTCSDCRRKAHLDTTSSRRT